MSAHNDDQIRMVVIMMMIRMMTRMMIRMMMIVKKWG